MLLCEKEQLLETVTEIDIGVYLANNNVAQNKEWFEKCGIKAVLNCSKDLPFYINGIHQMRICLDDTPESNDEMLRQLTPAIEFINANKPILIHCFAGMSRSPTVCAAYLMRKNGYRYGPQEAANEIISKRPFSFMWGKAFYYADALNKFYERRALN